ncbi:MAG: class I SAM-dependent methyltransferase [Candidatus Andersenbacteria bacterium]
MNGWLFTAVIGSILLLPTAYASLIGAPWVPTRIKATKKAFDILGISSKDVIVDLGCGDGKVLLEASARGARAIGYELSPIMWIVSVLRTWGRKNIRIKLANFYTSKLQEDVTAIFLFLVPKHMEEARECLRKQPVQDSAVVLSYAFPIVSVASKMVIREGKCAPIYMYSMKDIR